MTDILLINQPRINGIPTPREIDCSNPQKDFNLPPLGLAYLAAAARQANKTAKIIDLSTLNKDYNYLIEIIKKEKPKYILGGFTTATIDLDLKLFKIAKKYSKATTITYGPLATALKKQIFQKCPELDIIIDNEPELTLKEFLETNKKNIDGISTKTKTNKRRKPIQHLDQLPIPAYDLIDFKIYSVPYLRKHPFTIMRTSRGCVAKCTFCMTGGQTNPQTGYGSYWRAYSPERTIKEIKLLIKNHGIKEIWFFDDEFTISKQRVKEICKLIIKNKLKFKWICKSRVDAVDPETLNLMSKAGCYGIGYGVESANKNIIKRCKKNITNEQVEFAVKHSLKNKITPSLFFMIGLPGETEKTANQTINFAKKLTHKYGIRGQCTIATPYPGTEFYIESKKNKWFDDNYQGLEQTTASITYPQLSKQQMEKLHKKFYREVVVHPKRIIKRILRIRHPREIKNAFLHLAEFSKAMFTKTRYIR